MTGSFQPGDQVSWLSLNEGVCSGIVDGIEAPWAIVLREGRRREVPVSRLVSQGIAPLMPSVQAGRIEPAAGGVTVEVAALETAEPPRHGVIKMIEDRDRPGVYLPELTVWGKMLTVSQMAAASGITEKELGILVRAGFIRAVVADASAEYRGVQGAWIDVASLDAHLTASRARDFWTAERKEDYKVATYRDDSSWVDRAEAQTDARTLFAHLREGAARGAVQLLGAPVSALHCEPIREGGWRVHIGEGHLPRAVVASWCAVAGGGWRLVQRRAAHWVRVPREDRIAETLGVPITRSGLRRLCEAGAVMAMSPTPASFWVNLDSLSDHLQRARNPRFWTAERGARYEKAVRQFS